MPSSHSRSAARRALAAVAAAIFGLSLLLAPSTAHAAPAGLPDPEVEREVARDLRIPWGVAFLPSGDALVSERDTAQVLRVSPSGTVDVVGTVPGVAPGGQGGLMGLALSPDFATDRYVYAFLTSATDNRIVRMEYRFGRLGPPEVIFFGIERGPGHNGGGIAFGPDGMLYAGTGDAGQPAIAQDPDNPAGKILRMTPDGEPAPGNPDPSSVIYTIGHRNVQGLGWDSRNRFWVSEFGQDTWDELNLVRAGGNYGWPEVEGAAGDPRFIDPLWQRSPAEATPSGLAIVDDVIYIAGLRGQRLWRIPINRHGVGAGEDFFVGEYGRLRTVVPAPGGGLWLTTSNHDQLGTPRPGDDRILHIGL
ncbi:PQQ-dependent sugar dehydrogenase [Allonocardiopsis opalescens]|uniref:Glucose/arabinose dehydrogenase n=1 Tax=Allonocardiopsis opalescens TaxID=1144618 RepID=A0A2T0Q264_9ACTN|nr:PQQ-dependent sugar dehydrogenase [Allonocardiopsis opalescens]PRX97884.1 glucose/arabinose dehydrogenase [Allonocardiopsis opalescens]